MSILFSRRQFNTSLTGSAFAALLASGCAARMAADHGPAGYGPLVADPVGLIDLPRGFTYRLISSLGDRMDDGEPVPDRADGMGAFGAKNGRIILVRNH